MSQNYLESQLCNPKTIPLSTPLHTAFLRFQDSIAHLTDSKVNLLRD